MPNTPTLGLPYPVSSDTADVPRDIRALADKLDVILRPSLVSALPSSPADGQEVYFQSAAMATAGAMWHLRYTASASGYKWSVIGGPPLYAEAVEMLIGSNVYGDYDGPYVVAPLSGEYDLTYGVAMGMIAGENGYFSPTYGAPAVDADAVNTYSSTANPFFNVSRTIRRSVMAGVTIKGMSKVSGAGRSFTGRHLSVRPVRVG